MISVIDSDRFGVQIAKVKLNSLDELLRIERYAKNHRVSMAIGRGTAENLVVVQEAIRKGFVLMDTLVCFSYIYQKNRVLKKKIDEVAKIRLAEKSDAENVRQIASDAFRGYQSHYHADQYLLSESCDAVYADWAFRSCRSKEVADAVLLHEDDSGISGFGTLKYDNDIKILQGPIFAVHPRARGRGVFRSLIKSAKIWGSLHNALEFHYSTQITNLVVQHTLCQEGFLPVQYEYTLHKWFENDPI